MERKVYILGTSHEYQRNDDTCSSSSIDEFKLYLRAVCQLHRINAIGEEMSKTALEDFDRTNSISYLFVQEHGILKHKYCDPDRDERKKLGIKESGFFIQSKKLPKIYQSEDIKSITQEEAAELEWKEDLKKEPIWLCKALELNVWPLLFICGSKHVESFSKLLAVASFYVEIVNNNWEPQSK